MDITALNIIVGTTLQFARSAATVIWQKVIATEHRRSLMPTPMSGSIHAPSLSRV